MLTAAATIMGAIIGAIATIAAASIAARHHQSTAGSSVFYPVFFPIPARQRSEDDYEEEDDDDDDDDGGDPETEDNEKPSLARQIGIVFFVIVFFSACSFVTAPILTWMHGDDFPCRNLLMAFDLVSAGLLFCVARWLANRIRD